MGLTEAFGFEERWLRLLLKALPSDPNLLSYNALKTSGGMEEAQYQLGGIGNRQVLALRDWASGMGLVEQTPDGGLALSAFGAVLHQHDPDLEEVGSYWAIHHRLCVREDIWFYGYYSNAQQPGRFSRSDLRICLEKGKVQSESVLQKKVLSPLLQTMKGTKLGSDLGLLVALSTDAYERRLPDMGRLSPVLIGYMVLDWSQSRNRTTVNLGELMEWGAPGRYLGLSEEVLAGSLRRVQERYGGRVLTISQTARLNSVVLGECTNALDLLVSAYLEQLEKLEPQRALQAAREKANLG